MKVLMITLLVSCIFSHVATFANKNIGNKTDLLLSSSENITDSTNPSRFLTLKRVAESSTIEHSSLIIPISKKQKPDASNKLCYALAMEILNSFCRDHKLLLDRLYPQSCTKNFIEAEKCDSFNEKEQSKIQEIYQELIFTYMDLENRSNNMSTSKQLRHTVGRIENFIRGDNIHLIEESIGENDFEKAKIYLAELTYLSDALNVMISSTIEMYWENISNCMKKLQTQMKKLMSQLKDNPSKENCKELENVIYGHVYLDLIMDSRSLVYLETKWSDMVNSVSTDLEMIMHAIDFSASTSVIRLEFYKQLQYLLTMPIWMGKNDIHDSIFLRDEFFDEMTQPILMVINDRCQDI